MADESEIVYNPYRPPPQCLRPAIAALWSGRHIRRFYFHAHQAVLLTSAYGPSEAQTAIRNAHFHHAGHAESVLESLICLIPCWSPEYRDICRELRRFLEGWQELDDNLSSDVDEAVAKAAAYDLEPSYRATIGSFFQDVLTATIGFGTATTVRRSIPEELQPIFDLGEVLEKGLCRDDVCDQMFGTTWRLPTEPISTPPQEDLAEWEEESVSGSDRPEEDLERQAVESLAAGTSLEYSDLCENVPLRLIPHESFHPGDLYPDPLWFDDVPIFWGRAGLAWLTESAFNELKSKSRSKILRHDLLQAVRSLHVSACRGLAGPQSSTPPGEIANTLASPPATTGDAEFSLPALGLYLDKNEKELRRDAYAEPVKLTALQTTIVGALFDAYPKRLKTNAVRASWKDCGLVEPSDDNFYSTMNALRDELKNLGLACHSKRGEGYLLTRIP